MPVSQFVRLNDRLNMPTLGFGTWKAKPGQVEHAVEFALKNGYRHVDTAAAYGNEKEVGQGIKASGIPRNEIFLTTKLNTCDMDRPKEALEESLQRLGTDYVDLWLMHWPAPSKKGKPVKSITWIDTWKTMETIFKAHPDKVRAIGVSNVSVALLGELLPVATVKPTVNQIESHPACPQDDIIDFCRSQEIPITAYSPLGSDNSPLLDNPVVKKIAERHKVLPANVLISYPANKPGVAVLAKSVTEERILQNRKLIDLSEEEMKELTDIDKEHHFRVCTPFWTGWGDLGFPDLKNHPRNKKQE